MGADIHMMAELRQKRQMELYPKGMQNRVYENGDWKAIVQPFFTNGYFDHQRYIETGEEFSAPMTSQPYNRRSYVLFAILADVRNNWEIKPIAPPKGNPKQASPEWYAEVGKWEGDGHSHSWYTLAELEAVDWTQKIVDGTKLLTWAECVGNFFTHTMPELAMIAKAAEVSHDDIRIVFFFDN
jgi:hypothetical protein